MKTALFALALALLPAPAAAQSRITVIETEEAVTFEAAVGVADFVAGIGDRTEFGGGWTGRVIVFPRSFLAAEISYVGLVNALSSDAEFASGQVMTHGAEVLVRVRPRRLFTRTPGTIEPYVAAGGGWLTHQVSGDPSATEGVSNADALAVPVAAGIQVKNGDVTVDGRVTWRYVFDDELVDGRRTDAAAVTAMAGLGFTF